MTLKEIEKLYRENVAQLAGMDELSARAIKGWLLGIERNGGNYVRLSNYKPHRADYVLVEGDKRTLRDVAQDMGVILTDTHIEAYH